MLCLSPNRVSTHANNNTIIITIFMKKYFSKIYLAVLFVASALMMASCSKDNEPVTPADDKLPVVTMTDEQNFDTDFDVSIKVSNCNSAYYTINDGTDVAIIDSVKVNIKETSTITVVATNNVGQTVKTATYTKTDMTGKEYILVLNQGNYGSNNGRLSYYNCLKGTWTINWFETVNSKKLGDTPNAIARVSDNLFAITVNRSNLVQFIDKQGQDCGAIEIPNCRQICTDGNGYMYVTSYAHQLDTKTFTKGYVAKIDIASKAIVASCEVGWEPENIAYYKGKLYVANSGGNSYSESHNYDTTISVVNAETMTVTNTVDTGKYNLFGGFSQLNNYLCINAAGDYGSNAAATVLFDCDTESVVNTFDFGSAYIINDGTNFYTADCSYPNYQYTFYTITPGSSSAQSGFINRTIEDKIKSLYALYSLYYSKDNDYIYFTDAYDYASTGFLYCYKKDGEVVINRESMHICPGAILTYTK